MTKATTTTKKAYYRRARIQPDCSQTLQQLIASALAERAKVKDRLQAVDAAASEFRLITGFREVDGVQCGTIVTFERGSHQLVVDDDPEATTLMMAAIEPPKRGDKQQQFVPGALIFAVFENHVAIVQSAALRATAFEQHLAWLLRDQTGLLTKEQGIALVDEPKRATVDRIRRAHVKAVSIGRPFMDTVDAKEFGDDANPLSLEKKVSRREASKFKPDTGVLGLLKSFLPEDKLSKLELENAVFDGELEVWLEIKYPTRARRQPADTTKLIDDLALALRDQDEGTVELKLLDGSTISGNELKISKPLSLAVLDGVPQIDTFYSELAGWLANLLENNVVSS